MSPPIALKRKFNAVSASVRKCYCNVPVKIEVSKDEQKIRYAKCGTKINFSRKDEKGHPREQRLGCNMFLRESDVERAWQALNDQDRFATYTTAELPLDFQKEFAKCGHGVFAKLKVNKKPGKFTNRVMMTCGLEPPNKQCNYFKWISGGNDASKDAFGMDRKCDYQWLKDNDQVETEEKRRKMEEEENENCVILIEDDDFEDSQQVE